MRKSFALIALIVLIFTLPGFGFRCVSKSVQQGLKPVRLEYWRVWDGPDAFDGIIAKYRAAHPNVTIVYRKFRYEEYEHELMRAFAEDRGPDIFSLHNTWLGKYQNMLEPLPPQTTLVYPIVKGKLKKEVFPEMRTTKSLTTKDIENDFVDAVYSDVVIGVKDEKTGALKDQIFGLPLSVDTLAMYYNKDLLNNAGIPNVPVYWNREFQQNVKKLTRQDTKGMIVQSGVALGGSANIERASDILAVLMMQNGTVMTSGNKITFNAIPENLRNQGYNPGLEALRFYTDFANPAKEVYSWNKALDNSLDLFIQGKLAMMFGYSYHLPTIKSRAPKLNFSIAALPQIEGNPRINYANYWAEVVSKKILTNPANLQQGRDYPKLKADTAWDFIQFAARAENAKLYLDATKKPTALRSAVLEQSQDNEIGIFADQVLTAKSWYRGRDAVATENIFHELIDTAIAEQHSPTGLANLINNAARKVQQTIDPK